MFNGVTTCRPKLTAIQTHSVGCTRTNYDLPRHTNRTSDTRTCTMLQMWQRAVPTEQQSTDTADAAGSP